MEQLKKLPLFAEKRRHNWKRLRKNLESLQDRLILPEEEENSHSSWFGFLITVREESGIQRDEIIIYLEKHNIQTRLLFAGNLVRHPAFDRIRGTDAYRIADTLENTDYIMKHSFWVGVYPGMTDEMTDYMAEVIAQAVRR